jgi:hypothetical protein
MADDDDLANRIRELIADEPDVSEESMFGGLVFLVGGKMSVAAGGQGSLIVRVDPGDTDEFLAEPHAHPFVMGGRPMEGRYASTPRACEQNASSNAGSGAASRRPARFRRSGSAVDAARRASREPEASRRVTKSATMQRPRRRECRVPMKGSWALTGISLPAR